MHTYKSYFLCQTKFLKSILHTSYTVNESVNNSVNVSVNDSVNVSVNDNVNDSVNDSVSVNDSQRVLRMGWHIRL